MLSMDAEPPLDPRPVLEAFAHYGFRRASMEDLARALGVSRQTLYNRFRTKEALRDWALTRFAARLVAQAGDALAREETPTAVCLHDAFMRWTGDHVSLVRTAPHGSEIMVMGVAAVKNATADPAQNFQNRLRAFFQSRLWLDAERADALAFTMLAASKGLLVTVATTEAYATAMDCVIDAILAAPHPPDHAVATLNPDGAGAP